MRKFRKKIMRKCREKIKRKFREKNENMQQKNTKFLRKIHSLIVMVERVYCGRTDRNYPEKSKHLKEEKLLI